MGREKGYIVFFSIFLLVDMTATIKITEKTKKQIEHLQARLVLESGKKVSQMDLMERVFDKVLENSEILDIIMDLDKNAASKDTWLKKTRSAPDWGVDDSSADIDFHIAGR